MLTFNRSRMTFGHFPVFWVHASMTRTFSDDLPQLLDDVEGPMVELRHDLHAHPELAFHEHRTTKSFGTDSLNSGGNSHLSHRDRRRRRLHGAKPGRGS